MTGLANAAAGDAWRRWRTDREAILAVAGIFMFLPVLAFLLLAQEPPKVQDLPQAEQVRLTFGWFGEQLPWLALRLGLELFGSLSILILCLAPDAPDVRTVLRRALAALPGFAVAVIATWGITTVGLFPLILPGLYFYGRTALTGPALVAEKGLGFVGAIARSLALTHGNGWRVLGVIVLPLLAGLLAVRLIGAADHALRVSEASDPIVKLVLDTLAAGVATVAAIARALLQAALYRRLAAPRHGV